MEVMWLLRKLQPDHKTIADFRKDNRNAFKGVFRAFTKVCRKLDLFGGELIAVDGSKFKAVNSPHRHFTKDKLKKRLKELDAKIEQYLQDLDEADSKEQALSDRQDASLEEKIQKMKDRKKTYTQLLSDLEEGGENQVSLTDPDSRSMPKSPKAKIGYNAQTAVDDKHHLIIEQDVTNQSNDKEELSKISKKAKQSLEADSLDVVADRGYYNGEEIKDCEEENITPYVPKPDTSSSKSRGLYAKDQFDYDKDRDCYICPAGEILAYQYTAAKYPSRHTRKHFQHHYLTPVCKTCTLRPQCTTNKQGRCICLLYTSPSPRD